MLPLLVTMLYIYIYVATRLLFIMDGKSFIHELVLSTYTFPITINISDLDLAIYIHEQGASLFKLPLLDEILYNQLFVHKAPFILNQVQLAILFCLFALSRISDDI